MRLLLIDNHDSFSAILHHYLWELAGERPLFHKNDALTREQLGSLRVDAAVLSPGPGHPANPRDFGICRDLLEVFPRLPILGVCLGHQGLANYAGARIVPWPASRHGRPSAIRHDGRGLFQGLPQGFLGMRYHSLAVEPASLPGNLEVTAWSEDDHQIMALRFRDRPWFGVQFHPESVGTEHGKALLANFLDMAKPDRPRPSPPDSLSRSPLPPSGVRGRERESGGEESPFRELPWKDPERVFLRHFAGVSPAFWLDGPGWGASCMGRAESVFALRDNPMESFSAWHAGLDLIANRLAPWPGYRGGPVGHFDYELHRHTLRDSNLSPSGGSRGSWGQEGKEEQTEPFGRWMIPEGFLAFDRNQRRAYAAWSGKEPPSWLAAVMETWAEDATLSLSPEINLRAKGGAATGLPPFSAWTPSLPREEYLRRILSLQASIRAGDTYEACLTHAYSAESEADPLGVFVNLRRKNPAPYSAYFAFPDLRLLSASPELFLEYSPEGILRSRPIKGTRPRGASPPEDETLRNELAADPKDRAENLMIADLTRHDFSRVCALSSVEAAPLLEVEAHPALFQLVSEVRGKLEPGRPPLDAVWSCFPGGSMTGAPKERTVELLSAAEAGPRGAYSGALGYFTRGGAFRLSMVIRTLENRGRDWRIGCGGALLIDSDPETEWKEAELKAKSVIGAVDQS